MSRLARTNMAEAVARDMIEGVFKPVAMPVDVTDAAAFPEIAAAIAHARKLKEVG